MKAASTSTLALLLFIGIPSVVVVVQAHTRLECPPPRSGETGEKVGPCDAPDDPDGLPAYPLIPGALNTITWLESIPHPGAPARLALSRDGDDSMESFESCLLLDHAPHDEYSTPTFPDPTTWHRSSITIWIPDVYCERCHLQLMTVMSDEIHGVPSGTSCGYSGAIATGRVNGDVFPACPVVYHSCAPVSINGTIPRNEIAECNTTEFEELLDWPRKPTDSTEGYYDYSTYYYKGDPGVYNLSTSRLMMAGSPLKECDSTQFCDPAMYMMNTDMMMVPENASYIAMEGTCAAMVTMEVEDFEMGMLPSVPKNMSEPMEVPSGEADPCTNCQMAKPCFFEACALRNKITGNWTGQAAPCGLGFTPFCEFCFPDSPCFGYGQQPGEEETTDETNTTTTANEEEDVSTEGVDEEAKDMETSSSSSRFLLLPSAVGALVTAVAAMVM